MWLPGEEQRVTVLGDNKQYPIAGNSSRVSTPMIILEHQVSRYVRSS